MDKTNEYFADAMYYLKRAGKCFEIPMSHDGLRDGIVFFAFGMERLFKAILHDVNPVFVLQSLDIDSATPLYEHRLTKSAKGRLEKDRKKGKEKPGHVLVYASAMYAAERFSETVMKNQATLDHLAEMRNIIAHRTLSQLEVLPAIRFCHKHFFLLLEQFATELGFDSNLCYDGRRETLKKLSDDVIELENWRKGILDLITKHKAIRASRTDPEILRRIRDDVASRLATLDRTSEGGAYAIECPVCKEDAIASCELDGEYMDGEAVTTGIFVEAVECKFCDLELNRENNYELLDHFEVNERLYAQLHG